MTRQQLASRHQVSIQTIKRREKAGLLKPLLIGGTIRYRMADILEFERRCRIDVTPRHPNRTGFARSHRPTFQRKNRSSHHERRPLSGPRKMVGSSSTSFSNGAKAWMTIPRTSHAV